MKREKTVDGSYEMCRQKNKRRRFDPALKYIYNCYEPRYLAGRQSPTLFQEMGGRGIGETMGEHYIIMEYWLNWYPTKK